MFTAVAANSQELLVEAHAVGDACRGEDPAEVEGDDPDDGDEALVDGRHRHVRDIHELRGRKPRQEQQRVRRGLGDGSDVSSKTVRGSR